MTRRLAPLLFLLAPLLGACSTTPSEPDPTWKEIEVAAPSDRILWKIVLLEVEVMGFPLKGGLDPSSGEVESGWVTNLQPFRGQGERTRAVVEIDPVEKGLWKVRAHVQRQRNMALTNPLDPAAADWEWTPDDPARAEILLRRIYAAFEPTLEVGEPSRETFERDGN